MQDYGAIKIPKNYGKISFSRTEIKNILIAVGALTIAFTLTFLNGLVGLASANLVKISYFLIVSFIAVLSGFVLHELGHKFAAQRAGAWAEFRAHPSGLMMGIFFSFLGFIFALPGAVYIQGMISRKQNGLISLAGPATNLVLGAAFIVLYFISGSGLLSIAFYTIGSVNFLLAAFNLLPIPPLDGSKILRWNVPIYVVVFGVSIIMAILVFTGSL
ncbi:MAG: site-2 protease family protein [Euryarchaeota archaeon]|nr:site-2 protease family protein [Euryarchaeota archaeon]